MIRKLSWEKNFVVYHVKHRSYHKGFDSLSSARRSATCSNRNVGVSVYAVMPSKDFFAMTKI
jgi:hypothetical protein